MTKLNFQQHLLQFLVSHDPSEIILICWFAAQEAILVINVENVCAAYVFVEKLFYILNIWWIFFFDE